MNVWISWWKRAIAGPVALAFVLSLTTPLCEAANTPLPSAPVPAAEAQAEGTGQEAQTTPPAQNANAGQYSSSQQPLGTAAAPTITPEGVPASRPAGAAIAPAKQRRVRIIAIRVALIVGAAIAIGTVIGASEGSPARP